MACQLLYNLFAWASKNESKQPTVKLGLATYTYKAAPKGGVTEPGGLVRGGGVPIQLLAGSGSGELFYNPAHIEKFKRITVDLPASFRGEIKYLAELSHGPLATVTVQITDLSFFFAGSYGVQFDSQSGPLNGSFVPTCLPVPELGDLEGAITGFASGLVVMMHLTGAATSK